jgi:hypothetical protein
MSEHGWELQVAGVPVVSDSEGLRKYLRLPLCSWEE